MHAARKTSGELRRFGLTVGGVFLLLGTISWWRGHEIPPRILWTAGVVLAVPGALFPSLLAPVERGWMRMAEALAWFNTRVILGLLYFILVTPVGWVLRRFRDPMARDLDARRPSEWIKREQAPVDPARYRHQF